LRRVIPFLRFLGAAALVAGAAVAVVRLNPIDGLEPALEPVRPRPPVLRRVARLDAAQIESGRLPMERLPEAIATALEAHSEEIVRTAEALDQKQARITGTCAPGSAIRVIAEDGKVSCQRLPRGVVSVTALAGTPLQAATRTEPGSMPGGVGRYQIAGEPDFLVVPIPLPDGVQVTGFSYSFYDGARDVDGAAWLYRSDNETLASVETSGAAPQVRSDSTEQIRLGRVDASRWAYFVYFQMSPQVGADLMPVSASVSYRLP
jgi:hypothetical protein